jgi:spermidine/putrescine transport system substrate-binding protein
MKNTISRRSVLKGAAATAGGLVMMPHIGRAAEEKVVNVLGSQAFLPQVTRDKFTAQTGIQVNFRQGVTDAAQIFNLLASEGTRQTDMCVLAGHRNFSYIEAGMLEVVDEKMLPGLAKLNPVYLNSPAQLVDGKRYGIPVAAGFMMMGYRVSAVKPEEMDTWETCFGDAHTGRLAWRAGGIYLTLLFYLGLQDAWFNFQNTPEGVAKLEKASEQIVAWVAANKKKIRKWYETAAEGQQLFIGDEVDVGHGLADVIMPLVVSGDEFKRSIPKEGTYGYTQNYGITTGAPHRENTYKFIDFLLNEPTINGDMVRSTGGASTFKDTASGLSPTEQKAYAFTDTELARIKWLSVGKNDPRFPMQDKYVARLKD